MREYGAHSDPIVENERQDHGKHSGSEIFVPGEACKSRPDYTA